MSLILLAISRLAAYGQSILRLKSHTQTTSVRCHSRLQGCLLPFAQAGVLCHWLTPKPHLFAAIRAYRAVCCHSRKQGYYATGTLSKRLDFVPSTRSARRRTTCMPTTAGYVPCLQLFAAIRASRDCSLPFARALGLHHRYIAYINWALSLANRNISTYSAKRCHNLWPCRY